MEIALLSFMKVAKNISINLLSSLTSNYQHMNHCTVATESNYHHIFL